VPSCPRLRLVVAFVLRARVRRVCASGVWVWAPVCLGSSARYGAAMQNTWSDT
jgi:hypothetical protein